MATLNQFSSNLPQYHIRYLTLTSEELKAGQTATNLLTQEEEINILFSILYLGKGPILTIFWHII